MRQFFKDIGLQRDGPGIEYRERAPLVVPPSRDLPPPQDPGSVADNPAWPKDPDVQQRKSAAKKPTRIGSEAMEADARPLSRTELDKGRIPAGTGQTKAAPTPEESARPMRPAELKSKSIFSGMFSFGKNETTTFTEEPARESLTAPPSGYQTPSPNQPYGVGRSNERAKASGSRMTGARAENPTTHYRSVTRNRFDADGVCAINPPVAPAARPLTLPAQGARPSCSWNHALAPKTDHLRFPGRCRRRARRRDAGRERAPDRPLRPVQRA